MKLKSMMLPKPTKEEKQKQKDMMAVPWDEQEKYPYGLRISLNDKTCNLLGLKPSDFKVGGEVSIQCKAKVTEISESENRTGESSCRMEMQITEMGLEDMDSFEGAFDKKET